MAMWPGGSSDSSATLSRLDSRLVGQWAWVTRLKAIKNKTTVQNGQETRVSNRNIVSKIVIVKNGCASNLVSEGAPTRAPATTTTPRRTGHDRHKK